jgi:putative membrane protein
MQFLKTLFWVIVAVVMVLFASANWQQVTINLWGNLQADVKLPVLVLAAFLLGFLPTFLLYRARLWALQRRLDVQVQAHAVSHPAPVPTGNAPDRPPVGAPAE